MEGIYFVTQNADSPFINLRVPPKHKGWLMLQRQFYIHTFVFFLWIKMGALKIMWTLYVNNHCLFVYIYIYMLSFNKYSNGPFTRYAILRVAHAPGMPGTFSPPRRLSDPDMHHGTCVTHVPWCIPGSLTSGFLWSRWREIVPGIPGSCATRNFTYPVRSPWRGSGIYILSVSRNDEKYRRIL